MKKISSELIVDDECGRRYKLVILHWYVKDELAYVEEYNEYTHMWERLALNDYRIEGLRNEFLIYG